MKESLKKLDSIASIDVSRSEPNNIGGFTWTISFLEDSDETHRGDMKEFQTVSYLSSGTDLSPTIEVKEIRKGTYKEVQKISIFAGGDYVDAKSSFNLRFNGEITADILALPAGGSTCLGSTAAKQVITTSTEDTISEGGDDTVSPLTMFAISYKEYETNRITANNATCEEKSLEIASELMRLPPLKEVNVSGADSGAKDGGCIWVVSLLGVIGNPELFKGKYPHIILFYLFRVLEFMHNNFLLILNFSL